MPLRGKPNRRRRRIPPGFRTAAARRHRTRPPPLARSGRGRTRAAPGREQTQQALPNHRLEVSCQRTAGTERHPSPTVPKVYRRRTGSARRDPRLPFPPVAGARAIPACLLTGHETVPSETSHSQARSSEDSLIARSVRPITSLRARRWRARARPPATMANPVARVMSAHHAAGAAKW